MATNVIKDYANTITLTAAGTIAAGDLVFIGSDIVGIALKDATVNQEFACQVEGIVNVTKITGETWAEGDKIYAKPSTRACSKTYDSTNYTTYVGVAVEVVASGVLDGDIKLRGGAEAEVDLDDVVVKSLYDAHSILIATSDNTPIALTVAASRLIGRTAASDIDDLTPSQARVVLATTSEAEGDELLGAATVGEDRLAANQITGRVAGNVAADNVIGGIPVTHMITVPAAAGTTALVLTHKTRILRITGVKTHEAGLAGGTLEVRNGATIIGSALTWDDTTADKAVVPSTTLDDAQWDVAAGGTVNVVTSQAQSRGVVILDGVRVA